MRYCITSAFDTLIITCFTASVLVLLTLFCPQIVRDQECSQMSDVRPLWTPQQCWIAPSPGARSQYFCFLKTLWCLVKVYSLEWPHPKDCRDPAKVSTLTRTCRPLPSSPSSRRCSAPVGCLLSTALSICSSTSLCLTGWPKRSSVESEEMVGNRFPTESRWVSNSDCGRIVHVVESGFLGLGSESASPMMLYLVLA